MKGRLTFRRKGDRIKVYNKRKELLGWIEYYKKWKKFVWEQELAIMMSPDCLQEVVDYMKKLKRRV